MTAASSRRERFSPLAVLTLLFFAALTAVNLAVGLRVLRDPGSFPTSYWDPRWTLIFAAAFLLVGLLALFKQSRVLLLAALAGVAALVLLPVFSIGAGAAYALLALLALIAYGAGEFLLRLLIGRRLPTGLERFALSLLLGLGLLALLVMLQGMLFAYKPAVTWAGLGVLALIFVLPNLKRWFSAGRARFSVFRGFWHSNAQSGAALALAVLAVLWLPSWLIALAPANRYDEMTYHLTGPLYYLAQGGIAPYPEGWMHYAEMLFTLALQTAGQPLPRLLHLSMGMISTLLVFLFGRRLAGARAGAAAAILFFAVPAVGYESATAYIDLFVTAYTTAFGLALLMWHAEGNPRWLLAAGALGGIGLGIKLTAGSMVAGLGVILVVVMLIERRFRAALPWLAAMLALILTLALPWLIRDFAWTGDPFHPYGRMFMERITSPAAGATAATAAAGPGRLERLLRYPLDLVLNSRMYYHEAPGGFASALPLLAFPLFLFYPSFPRKIKLAAAGLLAASVIALGISILANSILLRYAIPVFPWLAVCAALNLEGAYAWFSGRSHRWGAAALALTLLVYVFSTRPPLVVRLYDNLPQRLPINYFLGRESSQAYLSRTLSVYDAFRFIDAQPGGPHRVLSVGNEFRLYTQSQIDAIYDTPDAQQMLTAAQTPADLARAMSERGYDYLLINQPEVDNVQWKYVDPYPILQNLDFWNTYGELVFVQNGVYVYRFDAGGVVLPPAVNLLVNGGFEEPGAAGGFAGWTGQGRASRTARAHAGTAALQLQAPSSPGGGGYVVQTVPVEAGRVYTLGYWIQSDQPAAFLMQVRWLDGGGNVIQVTEDWRGTTTDWRWYYLIAVSPAGARSAEVYASLGGAVGARVDGACLAAGQRCPAQ